MKSKPPINTKRFISPIVNRWDVIIVLLFVLFSGVYFLGCLEWNYPNIILSGDAGNIASYAAALDHLDWFKSDPNLNSTFTIGVYPTIHIPIIRSLYSILGNYGLASKLIVLPQTFLQLLGFYILGRILFKNRFWAFLLSFLTAMTVLNKNIGMGEVWGLWPESLPRVMFQSLLPFLLALIFVWKDRPRQWPWLMVFSGLLVYVHPVSAPVWGFAIWLSILWMLPKEWKWKRRGLVMLALGVIFCVTLIPFIVNYFSHMGPQATLDSDWLINIMQAYLPLNITKAFVIFLEKITLSLLLPLALSGFIATWLLKKSDRLQVKMVLTWAAGIFISAFILPLVENIITQRLSMPPLETELIRGIRYFLPLLLIFWLWPFAELFRRVNKQHIRIFFSLSGILFLSFWGLTNQSALSNVRKALSCIRDYHLVCSTSRPIDELLESIRSQTSPGDGIFFYDQDGSQVNQSISIRYNALRPLVYSYRADFGNRSTLPTWWETTQSIAALRVINDPDERLQELIPLAESLSAKYLVINFSVPPDTLLLLPVSVVMQNEVYTLLKLQ